MHYYLRFLSFLPIKLQLYYCRFNSLLKMDENKSEGKCANNNAKPRKRVIKIVYKKCQICATRRREQDMYCDVSCNDCKKRVYGAKGYGGR